MPGILFVDADASAAEMADALRRLGAQVDLVASGAQALARAQTSPPDAIVLCAELPDASGYAVCSKFKRDPQLAAVPVILTSAAASPEIFAKHQKLQTCADHYLHKPLRPEALTQLLAKLIPQKVAATPVLPGTPRPAPPEVEQDLLDISDLLSSLGQTDAPTPRQTPRIEPAATLHTAAPPRAADGPGAQAPDRPVSLDARLRAAEEAQQRWSGAFNELAAAWRDVETAHARLRRAMDAALQRGPDPPA